MTRSRKKTPARNTPFNELDSNGRLRVRKKMFQYWSTKMIEQGDCNMPIMMKTFNIDPETLEHYIEKDKWFERLERVRQVEEDTTPTKLKREAHNTAAHFSKEETKEVYDIFEQSKLSDKQKIFCIYYLQTYDATTAAKKAGYETTFATKNAYNLTSNPEVKRVMRELKKLMHTNMFVSAHDVLNEYVKIAFADITDFVEFNGYDVKLKNSNLVNGQMISKVSQGKDGVIIQLHDKMKALDQLSKLFELIPDKKLDLERDKFEHSKSLLGNGLAAGSKVVIVNDL